MISPRNPDGTFWTFKPRSSSFRATPPYTRCINTRQPYTPYILNDHISGHIKSPTVVLLHFESQKSAEYACQSPCTGASSSAKTSTLDQSSPIPTGIRCFNAELKSCQISIWFWATMKSCSSGMASMSFSKSRWVPSSCWYHWVEITWILGAKSSGCWLPSVSSDNKVSNTLFLGIRPSQRSHMGFLMLRYSLTKLSLDIRAWKYSSHEHVICDVGSRLNLHFFWRLCHFAHELPCPIPSLPQAFLTLVIVGMLKRPLL